MNRSLRPDVRNPLVNMPAARLIQALPKDARDAVRQLMREISVDANGRAQKCWAKSKAPMAAYWKAVSVYALHASRIAR